MLVCAWHVANIVMTGTARLVHCVQRAVWIEETSGPGLGIDGQALTNRWLPAMLSTMAQLDGASH
jgi:hypothetical protein